ncbi:major facilitator super transporter protein [Microbotryomycetes sp. JL221]|nr:major facilitator super transporter protein [Microbotryomycetes sp. JL221]
MTTFVQSSTWTSTRSGSSALTLIVVCLAITGIGTFLTGFFPVKHVVEGYSEPWQGAGHGHEPFTRLAFVLVDALRSDFVFGSDSNMSFVRDLITRGHALPYTATAQAPTVTLPRLKALTTGSNPTFLDAILNIAEDSSQSALFESTDSWIRQLAKRNKHNRLVFAGDDTWLRLFPRSWFQEADGVSSFLVTDTHIVDRNVTRHLDEWLAPDRDCQFDVMILHYLGLDHIGHLGGPRHPLMALKQREMDNVVRRIFDYVARQDEKDGGKSLIVLTGDHGMTEGGNHGGSTEAETSTALVLIRPQISRSLQQTRHYNVSYSFYERVQQLDLVPTLALLMGIGIPQNSMGKVIPSAISAFGPTDLLHALKANSDQITNVLNVASPGGSQRLLDRIGHDEETTNALQQYLEQAQNVLLSTFGDFHLQPMLAGLALLLLASGLAVISDQGTRRRDFINMTAFARFGCLAYLATFFASSFVEEEHEFWYFWTTTTFIVMTFRRDVSSKSRVASIALAATIRLMRAWSFNGQKNLSNNSLSSSFTETACMNHLVLTCATFGIWSLITLASGARSMSRRAQRRQVPTRVLCLRALMFATLLVLMWTEIALLAAVTEPEMLRALGNLDMNSLTAARAGQALFGLMWIIARIAKARDPDAASTYDTIKFIGLAVALASLTKPKNMALWTILTAQHFALKRLSIDSETHQMLVIALQHVSFFAFGGSNSLATVDLSRSYNGVEEYSVYHVAILTFFANFAGPAFWALTPLHHTCQADSKKRSSKSISIATTFFTLQLTTLACSSFHFRRHLFVWTVFSPALLYKAIWYILVHCCLNITLAWLQ